MRNEECKTTKPQLFFNRSTPRVDSFWGGHDDITAASGFEENGVTTIMFRKKIQVCSMT